MFNPWFRRGAARSHRKIAVIDRKIAFVGGININDDNLHNYEPHAPLPAPRWDFAVRVTGPLVAEIHREAQAQWPRAGKLPLIRRIDLFREMRKQPAARASIRCKPPSSCATTCATAARSSAPTCRRWAGAPQRADGHAVFRAGPQVPRRAVPGGAARRRRVPADRRGRDLDAGCGRARSTPSCWRPACASSSTARPSCMPRSRSSTTTGPRSAPAMRRAVAVRQPGSERRRARCKFAARLAHQIELGVADSVQVCMDDPETIELGARCGHEMAYLLYKLTMRVVAIGYA